MKHTNTETHRRVEAQMRRFGWAPMRQIEPMKADRVGTGELFELWQHDNGSDINICFVQFYGDGQGVEFYVKGTNDNTWAGVEKLLNAPNLGGGDVLADTLAALSTTEQLCLELMEQAQRIDAKLIAATSGNVTETGCELGEIARLRGQLSKNRALITKAGGAS